MAASSTLIMQSGLNKHSLPSDTATVMNIIVTGQSRICSSVGKEKSGHVTGT